jgi:predicted dehydrogenase
MYRYHPQMTEARALLDGGAIGDIRVVEASFSFLHTDETDVRFHAAWGGGSLLDVGCYCINACRYFFGGMPGTVKSCATFHPVRGVDTSVHGVLDFGQGRYGVISCGFDGGFRNRLLLCGTQGTITLSSAFANRLQATRLEITSPQASREVRFEPTDVFRLQIEDFARAVRGGPPPMLEPQEGLRNAQVIDGLLTSARRNGTPVRLA